MSDVNFIIAKPEVSQADFLRRATEHFPALADDMLDEGWAGLIHLQVACITRYANDCLANNNLGEFERMLRFVDQVQPKVDSHLDNALHVSFVEMLELDGDNSTKQAGLQLLSPWQLKCYLDAGVFYNGVAWREKTDAALRLRP